MLTLDSVFDLSFLAVLTKKLLKQNLARFVVVFLLSLAKICCFLQNLLDTCPNGACLRQNMFKMDGFNFLEKICS
jgi:hypothetical protein